MEQKRLYLDMKMDKKIVDEFAIKCIRNNIAMKKRVMELIQQDVEDYLNNSNNENEIREEELNEDEENDEVSFTNKE